MRDRFLHSSSVNTVTDHNVVVFFAMMSKFPVFLATALPTYLYFKICTKFGFTHDDVKIHQLCVIYTATVEMRWKICQEWTVNYFKNKLNHFLLKRLQHVFNCNLFLLQTLIYLFLVSKIPPHLRKGPGGGHPLHGADGHMRVSQNLTSNWSFFPSAAIRCG